MHLVSKQFYHVYIQLASLTFLSKCKRAFNNINLIKNWLFQISDRRQWEGFVFCQGIKYRQGEAVFLTPKCLDGGDRKEDLQVRSSSEKKTAANLSLRNHLKSKIVDETQVFYSFK